MALPLRSPDLSDDSCPLRPSAAALRASLPRELAGTLRTAAELSEALGRAKPEGPMPTGLAPLDRMLDGGLARGSLVELSARRSAGRFGAVLSALAATTSAGEAAALVDLGDGLDPRAAGEAGVELARLLWVRPRRLRQALLATEILIATGFPLVVLELGPPPLRGAAREPSSVWVRLARAAEAHEAALLVSSPWPIAGAAAAMLVRSTASRSVWLAGSPPLLAAVDTRWTMARRRAGSPGASAVVVLRQREAVTGGEERVESRRSTVVARESVAAR